MSAGPESTSSNRELGRPRNAQLDGVVLQAVREILADEGYQALSINKVTQRCGVHVRTIARRWDSKIEMVVAAIMGSDDRLNVERGRDFPTGDLRNDVSELINRNLAYLSEPATRAALPALLVEAAADIRAQERIVNREREWEALIGDVLHRAVESGDAPKRVLQRSHLVPTVLGSVTFLSQFPPWTSLKETLVDDLADFVLASLLAS